MILQVDDLTRPDHSFLQAEDECYYLGEYTARKGYSYSRTNAVISNLKKPVSRRGSTEYQHKIRTIVQCGKVLRASVKDDWIRKATIVPVPPSKPADHPLYDDRMLKVAQAMQRTGETLDIRQLVLQRSEMRASHASETGQRPRPFELLENYYLNEEQLEPEPKEIAIIDDLLTTGAHFKAMQGLLLAHFPDAHIIGLFIARRQIGADDVIQF